MKKKLSKRQLDVMKVLWDHSSPMVASDIVNGSPALNINIFTGQRLVGHMNLI